MTDDVSDIASYYNSDPAKEHSRLERHQLEHDLTWRYLGQYLTPEGSILEVGAATGRYTVELAKRGYSLTSVDLSAALLDECRRSVAQAGLAGRVRLFVADARDLSPVPGQEYDAALVMGPLYHLVEEADRIAALREAHGRLRAGGVIVTSFLSRFGVLADLFKRSPGWVEDQAHVRSFIERGRRPDEYPRGGFRGYSARPSEIAPLHEALGFETLVVAGVEPAVAADDEIYNALQGEQRQLWCDLLYAISAEPSIIGASRHLLYIGRKK